MRVLVTGGTGYLGSAIVRALARRAHTPIVFARHASSSALPGEHVDGDVRDRGTVRRAVERADAVCHTAALVRIWSARPADFDDINVAGLETVLDVCRSGGVPRIAITSSFLALPPAGHTRAIEANPYQRSKVRAREIARAAVRTGLPVTILVPGVIYGPGVTTEGNLVGRLVADHLAGRLPGVIGAERTWSCAYIDDVAEAHVAAIERGEPGAEYALGGANAPQMRLFEVVRDLTGTALPRRIPYPAAAAAAFVEELRTRATGQPPRLTRGTVRIFRHDWPLNSTRSEVELNYRVRPLSEGIHAVLQAAI
jgi:nucleoside-diphosphate-sugar epimerase